MPVDSVSRFQPSQPLSRLTVPPPGGPGLFPVAVLWISLPDRAAVEQIAGSIAARFPYLAEASNLDAWLQPVASALWLDMQTQFRGRDLSADSLLVDYLLAAVQANLNDSPGDLSTTEQTLQQLMDRRKKFIETLSNIMKSTANTAQTVAGNIK